MNVHVHTGKQKSLFYNTNLEVPADKITFENTISSVFAMKDKKKKSKKKKHRTKKNTER